MSGGRQRAGRRRERWKAGLAAAAALLAACGTGGRETTIGAPVLTGAHAPRPEAEGTRQVTDITDARVPSLSEPGAGTPADTGPSLSPRHARVVLRLGNAADETFRNGLYEGNNILMRGRRQSGAYLADGDVVASRWRRAADNTRAVFVLRDSLFSQQDHPTGHRPYALMLPPSWVTAAVAEVLAGRRPTPVTAPGPHDDQGWLALEEEELFGSFPPSETLHRLATMDRRRVPRGTRAMIDHARASLLSLSRDTQALTAAAAHGAPRVAEVGAELIAASDRSYFGAEARRDHVIPIVVENPMPREVSDEGKGFVPPDREVSHAAVDLARQAILGRRLADGDIAVERYDLSSADDRARALRLLEELVPRDGGPGGDVWLWVNGGLDRRGIGGRDATPFIDSFRRQVAAARVDVSRVRYLSKPHVELARGPGASSVLEAALARYGDLDLPLSLNIGSRAFARMIAPGR